MNEKKTSNTMTTAFGIPVVDDQNSLTAGPGLYAQEIVRRSSGSLSILQLSPGSIDMNSYKERGELYE